MDNATLKRRFVSLLSLCFTHIDKQQVAYLWHDICTHYTQPHRHYHTLTHIAHMFVWFDEVESQLHHSDAVQLAIWYHDIIYKPNDDLKKLGNERQSADYFINAYADDLPNELIAQIEALIMMTTKHALDATMNDDLLHDAQYFLDMDLAILGSEWTVYERYAKQVRLEYQHVPLAEYKQGRIAVLQGFLDKERVYFTNAMFNKLEIRARNNITKEIEQLKE